MLASSGQIIEFTWSCIQTKTETFAYFGQIHTFAVDFCTEYGRFESFLARIVADHVMIYSIARLKMQSKAF